MSQISKLATGLTATAFAMTAVVLSPAAAADPTIPLDPGQLPGLEAVQSLSPIIQQAAATPSSAQQLLLAAASQLAGNATTPGGSAALADAVTRFVQNGGPAGLVSALPSGAVPSGALPSGAVTEQSVTGLPHGTMPLMTPGTGNGPIPLELHVPAPGAIPGTEAHLPTGIDPAYAAGPVALATPADAMPAGAMPEVSRMVTPAAPAAGRLSRRSRWRLHPPRSRHHHSTPTALRPRTSCIRRSAVAASKMAATSSRPHCRSPGRRRFPPRARAPARRPMCSLQWELRRLPLSRSCRSTSPGSI